MRIRPSRGALGRVLVGLLLWGLLFVYGDLPHRGLAQSAFAQSPTQKSPPMTPVIEVSEKQDCPSERRVLSGGNADALYRDAHAICKSASKLLVAVVREVRVDGTSRECSGLALRERKDSRNLKWWKQSVGRGTVLCQGDVLVTWRGVEVSYVTFKRMLGPNGKPTAKWTTGEAGSLGELGRLALGRSDSTLMSGRLNYFYDPDYREHTIALGRFCMMLSLLAFSENPGLTTERLT